MFPAIMHVSEVICSHSVTIFIIITAKSLHRLYEILIDYGLWTMDLQSPNICSSVISQLFQLHGSRM